MRTSVQKMLGGYRPDLPHSGDMWLRAARIADVGRVNGCDQAYYRVHRKSMQPTTYAGVLADLRGRRDAFRSVPSSPNANANAEDIQHLLQVAENSVARSTLQGLLEPLGTGETDHDARTTLLAFARETSPEIVNSKFWRLVEDRLANGSGYRAVVWILVAWRKLQATIAWRRWRRTGIE